MLEPKRTASKDASAKGEWSDTPENGGHDESRFNTLFESVSECIKLVDRDGVVLRINAAGLALMNAEQASRIVGRSIYPSIAPPYRQGYRRMMAEVFQNGLPASHEYESIGCEGERRWLETRAVPLRDPNRGVTTMLAISRDITDRKVMDRQLEEQQIRLRTIIESEPECVKLQDADGIIIEMNPAGLALLEATSPDEVIGRSIYDFLLPQYHENYRALSKRVFRGERVTMEFEVMALNGEQRWLETHAAPLFDSAGSVSALLAVTRDINERKRYEEQIREQQNELAHVCRLSTMGEMATGLAHELNQPLCAVSSYSELAVSLCGPGNHELKALLGKIVSQTERATEIIQRLREFVHKQGPRLIATAPASVVDKLLQLVAPERRRQGVVLKVDVAEGLPAVRADAIQIEQVLLNLVTNAIEAVTSLPPEERVLTLVVARDGDDMVKFSLCNPGGPVPREVARNLFSPFFTTKENGMGMGLAISRSIVEAHMGTIGYQDVPAGGVCFFFRLPVDVE